MKFSTIIREGGEKVFATFKNDEATAMVNGDVVVYDVTIPGETAGFSGGASVLVAGVCAETIQPTEYGAIQIYGYHSSVKAAAGVNSGVTVNSAANKECAAGAAADDPSLRLGVCLVTVSGGRAGIFIKAM